MADRGEVRIRVKFAQCVGTVFLLTLFASSPAAQAQQAGKMWRIGYLSVAPNVEPYKEQFAAFREGLLALGWVEGKNIVIEQRHADRRLDRLPELAAELVSLKVDILVTFGGAFAAKKVTSTTPIVFIVEPDPVGTGLVASLARPGGNVTGLADAHADLVPKRLELLKEVAPSAARVAVLFTPASPLVSQLKTAQAAAATLGMTVLPVEVKGPAPGDFDPAAIGRGRPEATRSPFRSRSVFVPTG